MGLPHAFAGVMLHLVSCIQTLLVLNIFVGIQVAKKEGCTALTSNTGKSVKKAKNKCLTAFGICMKAEDAAVVLIPNCMSGAVKSVT